MPALTAFYAVVSLTCFTLVGLWWSAVDRHRDLLEQPLTRRLVGGVYISFLVPAVMGLFSQIEPNQPLIWRASFGIASIVGAVSTLRLLSLDRASEDQNRGPFRRYRWVAALLYALVLALGAAPQLAGTIGLTGIQAAAIAVGGLVVIAHGLAWELMTAQPIGPAEPEEPSTDPAP